jgi:hypothetical protein
MQYNMFCQYTVYGAFDYVPQLPSHASGCSIVGLLQLRLVFASGSLGFDVRHKLLMWEEAWYIGLYP